MAVFKPENHITISTSNTTPSYLLKYDEKGDPYIEFSTGVRMPVVYKPEPEIQKPRKRMAGKPLRKLLMEELGTDDVDTVDSLIDVIFDWFERVERNGNIYMSGGWRETAEANITKENETGIGR